MLRVQETRIKRTLPLAPISLRSNCCSSDGSGLRFGANVRKAVVVTTGDGGSACTGGGG